jgi:hypothetical protein
MPAVTRYLKDNDDHAHRQLLRWVSGDSRLVSFDGPVPEGMEPVAGAEDREEDSEARGIPL